MNHLIHNTLALSTIALFLFALPSIASAQSQKTDIRPLANQVVGDALQKTFAGTTHSGAYNFTREGKAQSHYSETHKTNGDVFYSEGDIQSKGLWFIRQDALCFAYEDKFLSGGCFRVYQVENCFYYYSARMPRRDDELDHDYWIARSTLKGESPKCEAAIS